MEAAVHVEIWSDIACPWCYIGKRRFEAALAAFEHADEVTVTWRSFELDPDAPLEREGDRAVHLAAKYGSTVEHAREMQQRMTDVAATEGLDFRFDLARGGTMFDAHRVIHLAKAGGLQDAMEERLFRAYLTEGEVVGDHAVLTRLAVEVGLDEAEVRDLLVGDRHAADVRDDERTGASLGITGVPFFVIDRAIGASGAQPSELLLDLLRQGWAARAPVTVVAGGESCGVDGC
jgi:predicted DsbA family dithiol-disulfide isomerase